MHVIGFLLFHWTHIWKAAIKQEPCENSLSKQWTSKVELSPTVGKFQENAYFIDHIG